ncbi:MAG: extracellular solute-binding protein [Cyclobacteriaceae bacterium]|nr:extracellular solute-binding protein [Cyclobacteriaceae bacterium]
MNIRKILFLFLSGIYVFTTSCHKKEKKDSELLFWSSNNPQEIEFAQDMIEIWNASNNPHISFQPVPEGQSSEEIILAAVVANTTPDIYASMRQGDVEFYAKSHTLIQLDTLKGFLEFMYARCDSSVMNEIRSSDGHIYQIPWKINPIIVLYNQDYYDELGVENFPRTYSEYLSLAEKFIKDRDGDGYVDQWFGYTESTVLWYQRFFNFIPLYYAASGGSPLIENNKAAFNNEAAVKVFTFLRSLYEKQYFPLEKLGARRDPFIYGDIATKWTGPWDVPYLLKFKPDLNFNAHPMPVPDDFEGVSHTYADPKSIVIFKNTSNPQKAWDFLQQFLSDENDFKFFSLSQQFPRRKDLLTNPQFVNYLKENHRLAPFAKQAKYTHGISDTPYMKEILDLISQEYEACVVYGKKEPEQAINDAAQAVNLLYLNLSNE